MLKQIFLMTATLLCASPSLADIFVIVHPSNSESQAEDIRRIYLGEVNFINHGRTQVYEPRNSLPIAKAFKSQVLQMSSSQYRSMWARSIFTGRNLPPKQMKTDEQMIEAIANNPHGIGYVAVNSLDPATKQVRILQRIHSQ